MYFFPFESKNVALPLLDVPQLFTLRLCGVYKSGAFANSHLFPVYSKYFKSEMFSLLWKGSVLI